jgi:glycine/D-amino acid oxidase-like deaminating enzyme
MAGLADAFLRHGGRLYTHSRVDRIETAGAAVRITVRGHAVTSDAVVVATNASVNGLKPLPVRHTPYISYAIGLRIPRRSIRRALFWDTETPYHYIRIAPRQGAGDLLLVGGGDHEGLRAHDVSRRHRHLEIWTRSRFPVAEDVEYAWSGRVLEPVDRLAFIGRHPLERGEVYVTTGDAGMGLTHGTIAGLLIADLIAGRANPWASLYDPARPSATMRSELARIAG